jgi:hypothetical protein
LLILVKDSSNVFSYRRMEVLLSKDIDDSDTEMVKRFMSCRFTYMNILINNVFRETVCTNANCGDTGLGPK